MNNFSARKYFLLFRVFLCFVVAYMASSKNALHAQDFDSTITVSEESCPIPDSVRDENSSMFIPSPSITYSPETNLSLGVYAMYYFKLGEKGGCTHPSNIQLSAAYTLNNQLSIEPMWEVFMHNDEYAFRGRLLYQKFPELFFGIGNNTADKGELYSHQLVRFVSRFQKRLFNRLFLGPQYHLQYMYDVQPKKSGLLVKSDNVTGADGGLASGVGAVAVWDSRDLILSPTKGIYAEVGGFRFSPAFGSKFTFTQVTAEVRKFFSLGPKKVLAVQLYTQHNSGKPPFRMLALMGNSQLMRGYYMGRYRDRNYIAGQVEYRFPVYKRFGMTVFTGAGQVAQYYSRMHIAQFHPSYGFGLRYQLSKKESINIRVDFGFGPGTNGQYITLGEAF